MNNALGRVLLTAGACCFIISLLYDWLVLPGASDPARAMYDVLRYQNTGIGFIAFGGVFLIIHHLRRYASEIKAKLDQER